MRRVLGVERVLAQVQRQAILQNWSSLAALCHLVIVAAAAAAAAAAVVVVVVATAAGVVRCYDCRLIMLLAAKYSI